MREKRLSVFFVGMRGAAEDEIFTKAVYIWGDSAEYYASLTYDKDCVLILLPFVLLIALNIGRLVKSIKQYRAEKRAEREAAAAEQKRENERLAEQARADREEVERLKEELRRLKERPDREGGPNDSEQ